MNGILPKIEIFAPFGAAYEWMKTMLFRPFDAGRWFVIAFAAFLSGSVGGGFNPGQLGRVAPRDWKYQTTSHGTMPTDGSFPAWLIGLIIVCAVIFLVLMIVMMWVSARGRFIFTDCIVKNRAAIAEPWREFRREGNSFFLFSVAIAFVAMALVAIIVLIIALSLGVGLFATHKEAGTGLGVAAFTGIILVALAWLIFAVFFAVVSQFMVPVMYRRRCSAKEAFFDVSRLIFHNPGPFILFVLFGLVLAVAVAVIGTIVSCLTCCIGSLPYISTVLLLPALVWLAAFKLLFVRQFGDQYDVWATIAVPEPAVTLPPPLESQPPAPPSSPPPDP